MNTKTRFNGLAHLGMVLGLLAGSGQTFAHDHGDNYGDQLGTTRFPVSCNEAASRHMEHGVALLHHMTYDAAEASFTAAIEADPDCAMGYWGRAMALIHPLWADVPDEAMLTQGWELIKKAKTRGPKTARERAYINALAAYYKDGWTRDQTARLTSFDRGWRRVHEQFPNDPEAACFYALAHMATADPGDKTYRKQREAGAIVEQVLAEIPDHPGAHHYIIHAYDVPALADRALAVARDYGNIAPNVPHALHMPTHIYTRLGLWQDSIEWNKRSAAAAWAHSADAGALSIHYLHALDYLAYAYLQRAEDEKAAEVLDRALSLDGPFQEIALPVGAYALAAIPARYALERHHWAEAAQLQPRQPGSFPWADQFAPMEAITFFARALGAARTGNTDVARAALDRLAKMRDAVAKTNAYWAQQIEIQRQSAAAWLAYEEGNQDRALEMMRAAAALEASTHKHPVTPGAVLPAGELLADMLLAMNRSDAALAEYEATLEHSPNRFNSLYGAGRAAELAGDKRKAATYYRELVELAAAGEDREGLARAKAFLGR